MYPFRAFNLAILSEIYFPEWAADVNDSSVADVQIKYGAVSPEGIDTPSTKGPYFQSNQQTLWLNIPMIARFLVRDGREVIIDANDEIDESSIRVFILTSCFRALLMQRGFIVLSGNAIKIASSCIAFVAPSGFGKSTLCQLFMNKGYAILSDDILAINSQLEVLPSYPEINLWGSIAQQLKIETKGLRSIRPGLEKYALPLKELFYQTPLPLKRIYMVDFHKKDHLTIHPIPANARLSRFETGHIAICQRLITEVELFELHFPRWEHTMNELGDLFERCIDAIEKDVIQGNGQ